MFRPEHKAFLEQGICEGDCPVMRDEYGQRGNSAPRAEKRLLGVEISACVFCGVEDNEHVRKAWYVRFK